MPTIESNKLGVSFSLPDAPTVLQVLLYDSARTANFGKPAMLVLWEMAKTVIDDWQCELLPDPGKADFGEADPQKVARIVRIVEFAGLQVSLWRQGLDDIPKN